jgi:hypothetical protein
MGIIARAYAFDTGISIGGKNSFNNWGEYISAFVNYALIIGMAMAILMILYAGIRYITSQGNSTALSDAKEIITGAILGFLVLILIKYILGTLNISS